jgi:hypothetical protein
MHIGAVILLDLPDPPSSGSATVAATVAATSADTSANAFDIRAPSSAAFPRNHGGIDGRRASLT